MRKMPKLSRKKPRGTHFIKKKSKKISKANDEVSQHQQGMEVLASKGISEPEGPMCNNGNIIPKSETVCRKVEGAEMSEPEVVVGEPEFLFCDEITHHDDDCERSESECGTSLPQEVKNAGMQITPLHDLSDVTSNVRTVSDIVVIDNINDKSNTEKTWLSLQDKTSKDVQDLRSPTGVIVIPGLSSPSPSGEQSYASDTSQHDSYDALRGAFDTDFPSETQLTLEDSTFSEDQPYTVLSTPAGTSRGLQFPSSERATSPASGSLQLLLQVKGYLMLLLPKFWEPTVLHDGIHVYRLADRKPTLVQRALFFSTDGTVTASINGKDLSTPHPFWQYVQKIALQEGSVKEFSEFVSTTVNHFRSFEMCKGVEDFRQVWKTVEDAEIDHNRFHEHRFNIALRSSECLMVVPSLKVRRCIHCQSLWTVLRKRSISRDNATNTPETKKPNKHLSTPQKEKRIAQKSRQIKRLRAANARYRERIESLINFHAHNFHVYLKAFMEQESQIIFRDILSK